MTTIVDRPKVVADVNPSSLQELHPSSLQGQSRRRYGKRGALETSTRIKGSKSLASEPEVHREKTLVIRDRSLARGFAAVPRVILRDFTIPAMQRLLYALLLDYAWQDGECFPGQARLAKDMGVSGRYIITLLAQLQKKKLISIQRQGLGKTNIYYIEPLGEYIDKHQFNDPGGRCGF